MIYPTHMMKGGGYMMGGGSMKGGGKGAGKWVFLPTGPPNKAAGRKRKAVNNGPGQALDEGTLNEIMDFVQEKGGSAPLGQLTTVFEGVKKVQLEEHFKVEEVSSGNYTVSLSDEPPAFSRTSGGPKVERATKPKKHKEKAPKDPDAPPPPDLESDVIDEITQTLEANGGVMFLGRLASQFEGLKKAQLEGHFELEHGEKDTIVRLSGATSTGITGSLEEGPKKKRKKIGKSKDAPPPGPLDEEMIMKITDYLNDCGGSAALGKVTTAFEGVKKAQLEDCFVVSRGVSL